MSLEFHIIIPARYQSSRLPGKLAMDIAGQSCLERTYRQALAAGASSVTIACDHEILYQLAKDIGAEVMMTSVDHPSGTDRIAEVVRAKRFKPEAIVLNVQGDEPFIAPENIRQLAECLSQSEAKMATLAAPISDLESILNPNLVKVVLDKQGRALYFSRAVIPTIRDAGPALTPYLRHIGLYAYRAGFLLELVSLPEAPIERMECLEQLRALWNGYPIQVELARQAVVQDVNCMDDLKALRAMVVA